MITLNTKTLGVTEYQGLALTELAQCDGVTYGLDADRLVGFTEEDDDGIPIDAWAKTGMLDFGSFQTKGILKAYLHLLGKEIILAATANGRTVNIKEYVVKEDEEMIRKIIMSRTSEGVYWEFEIRGKSFYLKGLAVVPSLNAWRLL